MAIRATEVDSVGRVHVTCIEVTNDATMTLGVCLLGCLGKQFRPFRIGRQGMRRGHAAVLGTPLLKKTRQGICTQGNRLVGKNDNRGFLGRHPGRAAQNHKCTQQCNHPAIEYHEM